MILLHNTFFPLKTGLFLILLLLVVFSLVPVTLLRWCDILRIHGIFSLPFHITQGHISFGHRAATVSLIDGLRLIPKYFFGLRDDGKEFLLIRRRVVGGLNILMRFDGFLKAHTYQQIMCKIHGVSVLEVVADHTLVWRFGCAKSTATVRGFDLRLGESFHSNRIVY